MWRQVKLENSSLPGTLQGSKMCRAQAPYYYIECVTELMCLIKSKRKKMTLSFSNLRVWVCVVVSLFGD